MRLTKEPIQAARMLGEVGDPGAGAVVLFLGTVRDMSEVGRVQMLEYEAYAPMAEKSLALAEEEVRKLWPETKAVRIVHRIGKLGVGEVSVAVAVSSPHRAEAFEACRHAMERVKRDVPIWKKEKLAGGTEAWVEGSRLRPKRTRRPARRAAKAT